MTWLRFSAGIDARRTLALTRVGGATGALRRLRQRRLRSDNQAVELQLGRLNERLVAKERELGNRMVKERTLTDAQAGDKRKLKEERDEAQRALTQMQQKSSQFQHELRKKDRAYAKLQEHLNGCAPVAVKFQTLTSTPHTARLRHSATLTHWMRRAGCWRSSVGRGALQWTRWRS